MIIQNNEHSYNGNAVRFRPNKKEGRYIQYMLNTIGFSLTKLSQTIKISIPTVFNVIYGRRHSRRVEAEIARILGHTDWNDVVIEARLAISGVGKPTKTQIKKARNKALKDREAFNNAKRNATRKAYPMSLKEAV